MRSKICALAILMFLTYYSNAQANVIYFKCVLRSGDRPTSPVVFSMLDEPPIPDYYGYTRVVKTDSIIYEIIANELMQGFVIDTNHRANKFHSFHVYEFRGDDTITRLDMNIYDAELFLKKTIASVILYDGGDKSDNPLRAFNALADLLVSVHSLQTDNLSTELKNAKFR